MDLGRTDLMLRAGITSFLIKAKAAPVLNSVTMRYRRELKPFEKYTLETQILCWDEKWIYMEQRFKFATGKSKGRIAAIGLAKGSLYSKKEKEMIAPAKIASLMKSNPVSPDFPAHVKEWIKSDIAIRDHARAEDKRLLEAK